MYLDFLDYEEQSDYHVTFLLLDQTSLLHRIKRWDKMAEKPSKNQKLVFDLLSDDIHLKAIVNPGIRLKSAYSWGSFRSQYLRSGCRRKTPSTETRARRDFHRDSKPTRRLTVSQSIFPSEDFPEDPSEKRKTNNRGRKSGAPTREREVVSSWWADRRRMNLRRPLRARKR